MYEKNTGQNKKKGQLSVPLLENSQISVSFWELPLPWKKEKNRKCPKEFMNGGARERGRERESGEERERGACDRSLVRKASTFGKTEQVAEEQKERRRWLRENSEGPTDRGFYFSKNQKTTLDNDKFAVFIFSSFWGFFRDTAIVPICCNSNHSNARAFLQTRHASRIELNFDHLLISWIKRKRVACFTSKRCDFTQKSCKAQILSWWNG